MLAELFCKNTVEFVLSMHKFCVKLADGSRAGRHHFHQNFEELREALLAGCYCMLPCSRLRDTVVPRHNDLRYNNIPDVAINIFQPGQRYNKRYRTKSRFNVPRYNLGLICTSVFFKNLKLYKLLRRVQFEIFEKLTSVNKSQIEREKPYDYLLIIYMKTITEDDSKGRTKKNTLKIFKNVRNPSENVPKSSVYLRQPSLILFSEIFGNLRK